MDKKSLEINQLVSAGYWEPKNRKFNLKILIFSISPKNILFLEKIFLK
jgi:hypothetical protein